MEPKKKLKHLGLELPEMNHVPTRQEITVLYQAVDKLIGKSKWTDAFMITAIVLAMAKVYDWLFELLGWFK